LSYGLLFRFNGDIRHYPPPLSYAGMGSIYTLLFMSIHFLGFFGLELAFLQTLVGLWLKSE